MSKESNAETAGQVRIGVIGVGSIGRAHVDRIHRFGPPAQLIAVTDTVPEAAAGIAAEYGVTACASSAELLARPDIDAVIVAVPSALHGEVAVQTLDAGKHVLLEKPIEVTTASADKILAAHRRAGTVLNVASQRRFAAHNQFAYRVIRDGHLGRIVSATVELAMWRTQEYYDERPWRGRREHGGDALMNQGIHFVDLLLWLLGDATEVMAYGDTLAHDRIEVEDTISVVGRLSGGSQLVVHATTGAYPGLPLRYAILGDQGCLVVEGDRITRLETATGLTVGELEPVDEPLAQLADFLRAVTTNTAPLVTGEQARAAVAFIEAVHESNRAGAAVRPSRPAIG